MQGYTVELLAARESYLSGARGIGELTGCVQSCVSLWEHGLSIAEVTGTDYLTPQLLGIVARSLALRGEAVLYIAPDLLLPASDWDLSTRGGVPRAYRLSISEAGGGVSQTALASEVLHFRIGSDATTPWTGTSPLARAKLTAGLLHAVETALSEVYQDAPLGTQIVTFPESQETDMQKLGNGFRGKRGRVLLKESVNVTSAGGPTPNSDWTPSDLTPDLSRSLVGESLEAARNSILSVYGVLPGLFNAATTGPLVREAQRHLAQWYLQPIAQLIAHEASAKLDAEISVDTLQPLCAFDLGQRSRSLVAVVEALARAKEAGVDMDKVLHLTNWDT
jgi:phage portal protein BeeE